MFLYNPLTADGDKDDVLIHTLVELIIFLENIAMVILIYLNWYCEVNLKITFLVAVSNFAMSVGLKIIFYLCFHPWSNIIRHEPNILCIFGNEKIDEQGNF